MNEAENNTYTIVWLLQISKITQHALMPSFHHYVSVSVIRDRTAVP